VKLDDRLTGLGTNELLVPVAAVVIGEEHARRLRAAAGRDDVAVVIRPLGRSEGRDTGDDHPLRVFVLQYARCLCSQKQAAHSDDDYPDDNAQKVVVLHGTVTSTRSWLYELDTP